MEKSPAPRKPRPVPAVAAPAPEVGAKRELRSVIAGGCSDPGADARAFLRARRRRQRKAVSRAMMARRMGMTTAAAMAPVETPCRVGA